MLPLEMKDTNTHCGKSPQRKISFPNKFHGKDAVNKMNNNNTTTTTTTNGGVLGKDSVREVDKRHVKTTTYVNDVKKSNVGGGKDAVRRISGRKCSVYESVHQTSLESLGNTLEIDDFDQPPESTSTPTDLDSQYQALRSPLLSPLEDTIDKRYVHESVLTVDIPHCTMPDKYVALDTPCPNRQLHAVSKCPHPIVSLHKNGNNNNNNIGGLFTTELHEQDPFLHSDDDEYYSSGGDATYDPSF